MQVRWGKGADRVCNTPSIKKKTLSLQNTEKSVGETQVLKHWIGSHWEELQRVGQPTISRACVALLDGGAASAGSATVSGELLRQLLTSTGQLPFSSSEADSMLRCASANRVQLPG